MSAGEWRRRRPGSKRAGVKQVHAPHTCRECDQPGHNSRRCPALDLPGIVHAPNRKRGKP